MASFYTYLISSLPMLHFGARPPFSFEKFFLRCEGLIPQEDFQVIKNLTKQDTHKGPKAVIKKWLDFDTMLRNELVKLRASRKKIDPAKYLRPDGYAGSSFYHIALAAQRNPSPLEGERLVDLERWNFLEGASFGHYFDLEFLIIYAYKLLILERWERINSADKNKILDETLAQH